MQLKAFRVKVQEQKPSLLFCHGRTLYLPEIYVLGYSFFLKLPSFSKNYLYCFGVFFFWLYWGFVTAQGLSLAEVSKGCSLVAASGFPIVVASLVAEHRL